MWWYSQIAAATVFTIPLCKCPMVVQHEEPMQQFLCLRRRPYANGRLSNLRAVPHQCTLCASSSQSLQQISLTNNKILSHFSVHFSHPFSKVWISDRNKNNVYKNHGNWTMKSDNEVKLRSLSRINQRSHSAVWLRAAMGSFPIQSKRSVIFGQYSGTDAFWMSAEVSSWGIMGSTSWIKIFKDTKCLTLLSVFLYVRILQSDSKFL